ncbi:MAG TPA: ribose-5-phosphate isomerase RpiA [Candidatus Altiarchaeales archaeon]|nr:ribose-5-phosphate isomerase RpiA [Candidatus Altiarchaeales archaeon]
MSPNLDYIELSKKTAAEKAVEMIKDGSVVGLGTGSTAKYAIERLSLRIREENLELICIPTSSRTRLLASNLGIKLASLEDYPDVDIAIDGADEVDRDFNLIKGGGGAHTLEKLVAASAKKFVVIIDERKLSSKIGNLPVPVEFLKPSKKLVERELLKLGGKPKLRENFMTDFGNFIFDTTFDSIKNPKEMEEILKQIPGVVESGIFSKRKPEMVIVGKGEKVEIYKKGE